MMLKNLFQGALLVALMLTIFLRFRLAFWVMVGLPVCFLGAMMMMPVFGITINILSLFAFIMVLGIVVDDAIVIGESAYSEIEEKGGGVESVVRGAKRVATPATFGVLTTIAVFAPIIIFHRTRRGLFLQYIGSGNTVFGVQPHRIQIDITCSLSTYEIHPCQRKQLAR